ncbi:hypothetical protein AYI70_g11757 [Smittium culicis]|uniref:Uncharacterized protein n=1 Tax=Smittium culicis TaxID=133412 RepID=A0A1R1X0E9_9FUNG|nr:hypothetical protein AYI70_g11757 [Smittium culicis]
MSSSKSKRVTEVDVEARHKHPKHDVSVVIRSLVGQKPKGNTKCYTEHAMEACKNLKKCDLIEIQRIPRYTLSITLNSYKKDETQINDGNGKQNLKND